MSKGRLQGGGLPRPLDPRVSCPLALQHRFQCQLFALQARGIARTYSWVLEVVL